MKTGHKRMLIFTIILLIIFLFNSFIFNLFNGYKLLFLLVFILYIFNYIFVIERRRSSFFKDILFEVFLILMTFFILYYLLGLIVGLVKTLNYFNIKSIITILLPLILYTILREILRYNMLLKSEGNNICITFVIMLFILMDTSSSIYNANFSSGYEIFKLFAMSILPAISKNIAYSYVSKNTGYIHVIVFDLVFTLYPYIIPIIPNPNEYIVSIINLVVPIVFAFRILKFFEAKKKDNISSDYHRVRFRSALIPACIILFLIYFYSGYFRFYVVAIASGSMTPNINKGDIAIVDRNITYDDLEVGQVLAFKKGDVIIVHRIVKKVIVDGEYIYYTKGDFNNNIDDFVVNKDMAIGKVEHKISYLGYPTVWFSGK